MSQAAIRKRLTAWYGKNRRDLPWRRTKDPYAIWISEIMLQQTRVAAAIPYYERFLNRFPGVASLAAAPEAEVLALWGGLGYYSRARNLRKAAAQIVASGGGVPREYAALRELAGVGDYTAAAVGSIAFGLPHAAIDGNVKRVIARLMNDAHPDVVNIAGALLDRRDPGGWNQALMELGAVVCLPRQPMCATCPVAAYCEANRLGTQGEVPAKPERPAKIQLKRVLLIICRDEKLLLVPSPRVRGFWDLPEPDSLLKAGGVVGTFRHTIMNSLYQLEVRLGTVRRLPAGARWWGLKNLDEIPLSTTAKKALRCWNKQDSGDSK